MAIDTEGHMTDDDVILKPKSTSEGTVSFYHIKLHGEDAIAYGSFIDHNGQKQFRIDAIVPGKPTDNTGLYPYDDTLETIAKDKEHKNTLDVYIPVSEDNTMRLRDVTAQDAIIDA